MDFFLQRIVALCVFFSVVNGMRFFVEPSHFYEHDEDVEVKCNLNDELAKGVVNVHSMKIQEQKNGSWSTVAVINYDEILDSNFADMSISGYVGRPTESYLMLTWFEASPYFFGKYRCEAVVEDKNDDYRTVKSDVLDIRGLPRNTHNVFDLLRDNHNKAVVEIQEVLTRTYELENNENEKFQNASMNTKKLSQAVDNLQEALMDKVLSKLSDMATQLARVEASVNKTSERPTH